MSHNNGLIVAPINVASDIGEVLGTGSGDVGTNCTSSNINIFSKYKPNELEGYAPPTGSDPDNPLPISDSSNVFYTNGYGLDAFGVTDLNTLKSTVTTGWRYRGPNFRSGTKYYRVLDFDGYYHNAPCPFEQINGNSVVIDLVNEASPNTGISFYILLKNGANANQSNKVPASYGIYNYMNSCITVEDNIFEASGSRENLLGGCVGIILYDNWTNNHRVSIDKFSESPIAITTQRDQDMYTLNLASLASTLNFGEYKAVACVRKAQDGIVGYKYYPAYSTGSNPNPFTLNFGGINYYPATLVGISDTDSGTPEMSIVGTDDEYTITVSLKNNWPGNFTVRPTGTPSSSNKFFLRYIISISTDNGNSWTTFSPRSAIWLSDSSINLLSGESGNLKFTINRIWQSDPTEGSVLVDSGTIAKISTSLWFHRPPDTLNPTADELKRQYNKTVWQDLIITHA